MFLYRATTCCYTLTELKWFFSSYIHTVSIFASFPSIHYLHCQLCQSPRCETNGKQRVVVNRRRGSLQDWWHWFTRLTCSTLLCSKRETELLKRIWKEIGCKQKEPAEGIYWIYLHVIGKDLSAHEVRRMGGWEERMSFWEEKNWWEINECTSFHFCLRPWPQMCKLSM